LRQHHGRVLLRHRARSFYSIRSGWNIALNRRFAFQKRSQYFIYVRNETLPVVAMRISKEKS
jgi:hypothetical protein